MFSRSFSYRGAATSHNSPVWSYLSKHPLFETDSCLRTSHLSKQPIFKTDLWLYLSRNNCSSRRVHVSIHFIYRPVPSLRRIYVSISNDPSPLRDGFMSFHPSQLSTRPFFETELCPSIHLQRPVPSLRRMYIV